LDNEDTGVVKDATCQCPMGQYKCHHIAAALLFGYVYFQKTQPIILVNMFYLIMKMDLRYAQ